MYSPEKFKKIFKVLVFHMKKLKKIHVKVDKLQELRGLNDNFLL